MKPSVPRVAEHEATRRYEQMRESALGGAAGTRQWGAALFVRSGMATWLLTSEAPQHQPERQAPRRLSPPGLEESKLVDVLATVILNNYSEQCHA